MKNGRYALVAFVSAGLLSSFSAIQRLVILPYYNDGHANRFLSLVNRLSSIVILPGKIIVYRISPPIDHTVSNSQFLASVAVSFAIYFVLGFLLLRILGQWWSGSQPESNSKSKPLQPLETEVPHSPQRRSFLVTAACGTVGMGVLAGATYPVMIEPGWLKVRRLKVPIKGLPPSLNGLTLVQLSDFHHDEWISIDHVHDAIRLANSLQPDIMLLTGDYVTSTPELIAPAVQALQELKSRIGSVGVLGNHDWWTDVKETRRQFENANIPLIDNDRLFVTANRKFSKDPDSDAGLCIAGVGDLWEDTIEPERALRGVSEATPRLLLSHNPDAAEEDSIRNGDHRIDLMISGHTHGGQVRLPFIGTPIVPSAFGSKYVQGLVDGPACRVQISAGIGLAMLPIRFNVPPEIVHITLQSA